MDNIEKLFRKINKKDRIELKNLILKLKDGNFIGLNIKKLKDSDFYRVRKKRFRVIFHYEGEEVIVDSMKLRNEKTYKNM